MYKKVMISSIAITMAVVASLQIIKAQTPTFSDINGHWGQQAILKAVEESYVDGYPDGTFKPDNTVSRAEFITMLTKALKLKTGEEGAAWYSKYTNAAVEAGIHRYEEFSQDINDAITRQEMMRLIVRATRPDLQHPEVVEITDKAVVYQAVKAGLIQGLDRGTLGLAQATTRAQAMTVVDRVLQTNRGEGDKLEVDKYALNQAEIELKGTNLFSMIPVFAKGVQAASYSWSPDKLVLETKDGLFKGQIDQVIAIDMADPNDPNRDLLGDIDELHWFNTEVRGITQSQMPLIKDYPDSYVILVKSHVDYINDTTAYSENGRVGFSIYGFASPNKEALKNGELNTLATVFKTKRGDTQAMILPKTGFAVPKKDISFAIDAPARPPVSNSTRTIVSMYVPDGK
ncbi:S-layer homology domain-containing protein [Paenibacillus allorhizosphaerae]|uniref:SLH domain-containing protein n=1 Tax=Paenibacillus allorhizosphaerae TaxID=2849866 RepID=A0ABM8VUU6_9BACL|nr:S-layer homology domain-containing protein [Paenibacillus allorhizosphaerae]CAG7658873.1 hypothetical protein PAECIP111802_07196 [Paenibacillus allorhizosphaerae]